MRRAGLEKDSLPAGVAGAQIRHEIPSGGRRWGTGKSGSNLNSLTDPFERPLSATLKRLLTAPRSHSVVRLAAGVSVKRRNRLVRSRPSLRAKRQKCL